MRARELGYHLLLEKPAAESLARCEEIEPVEIHEQDDAGYAGHGGGDWGLVDALDGLFRGTNALPPGLDGLAGHRLAFLAEQARVTRNQRSK